MTRGGWGPEVSSRWALFALLALALVVLWLGWREFWFLCDDAYITWRYISNRQLGLGYVWNPPPFRPVEGYSNFLWMVLLDGVWTLFRVEPPSAANVVSLLCAALSVWRVWRWSSTSTLRTALALLLLLSNRTFFTWSSSGLETALFNLLLLLWVEQAWCRGMSSQRGTGGYALLALWASLATLTRPDGLLLWGATVLLGVVPPRLKGRWLGLGLAGGALALVPLHLLWRHHTYGEWLPNTYYAKHVAPWPEAGLRYLACFVVEYGYWALGLLALVVLVRRGRRALTVPSLFRLVAGGTVLAQTAYYVLRVGGDHFEYRVLSQWVPLLALAWAALLAGITRGWLRVAALALSLLAALPIQWSHYAASRVLTTRNETWKLKVTVAPRLGPLFAPLATWFDEQQAWLIEHHVCMRHQEHKVFGEEQRRMYPTRAPVPEPPGDGVPVIALSTVGVPGWAFPNVAVLDIFGLNDFVIARNAVSSGHFRLMAHDRAPPSGYVACFRPNVDVVQGVAHARPRAEPLTPAEVTACEHDFLALVRGEQPRLPSFVDRVRTPAVRLSREEFDALTRSPEVLLRERFDAPVPSLELLGFAFGAGPTVRPLPDQQPITGASGGALNSYHRGDLSVGLARFPLPPGTQRVALEVAGGANCQALFAGVVAGDEVLAKACGNDTEALEAVLLTLDGDVKGPLSFVAFDGSSAGWGHVIVDEVVALGAAAR